jgi:hypothetical protein
LEEAVENWKRFGRFKFLINWGEPFDGVHAFIIRQLNQPVRLVYQVYPETKTIGVALCDSERVREAISAFLHWIDQENVSPMSAD